jgi:endonuclease G, mitochondrial
MKHLFSWLIILGLIGAPIYYFKDKIQEFLQGKSSSSSTDNKNNDKNNDKNDRNNDKNNDNKNVKVDETFALPEYNKNDKYVIKHDFYTLHYRPEHGQADWVAYRLEGKETEGAEGRDNFRPDPKLGAESPMPNDYTSTGFDRGHLAPAADFKFSKDAQIQCFYMSNMSPQAPELNRGIWKILEDKVRTWAKQRDEVYVVAGGILEKGLKKIGKKIKISVPKYYYKIILDMSNKKNPDIICFMFENKGGYERLESYIVTMEEIEKRTGINFFPKLPSDIARKVKKAKYTKGWF